MKKSFSIIATSRSDMGKGASRRLRRADQVPGIVYGASKKPEVISIEHKLLASLLANESFYTQVLDLEIDGKKEYVILRDLQRHHFKPRILHIDLQRINEKEKITMRIPLHFIGGDIAPVVKLSGGLISRLMSDVEVRCLPNKLPEYIEIDLSKLEINQTIHLSDLKLEDGVEFVSIIHGEDKSVATAYTPNAAVEDNSAPMAAAAVPATGQKEEAKAGDADKSKAKPKADAKKGK